MCWGRRWKRFRVPFSTKEREGAGRSTVSLLSVSLFPTDQRLVQEIGNMSDILEYRCFIGGLSWSTSDRSLQDAFQKFGHVVEAKVVVDRDTGRSRGFGFVTFEDKKAMEDAIDRMHGMDLDGRSITVDKAQPRSAGNERGDRGYGGGSGECFKCGQRGHFARECPDGDGYRGGDRYSSRSDRYGGGGNGRYGPDRNGDRYGGRPRDGGSRGGSGSDRYNRDRSGPYDRPSGGGSRSSYDDRR